MYLFGLFILYNKIPKLMKGKLTELQLEVITTQFGITTPSKSTISRKASSWSGFRLLNPIQDNSS